MSKFKLEVIKVIDLNKTYKFYIYQNEEILSEFSYYDGQDFSESHQGWGEFVEEDLGLINFRSEPYKEIYPYTLIDSNNNEHIINNKDELWDFYDLEIGFNYKYPLKIEFDDGSVETVNGYEETEEYLKQKNLYVETIDGIPVEMLSVEEFLFDDLESAEHKIKSIVS